MNIEGIDHVAIAVRDLDETIAVFEKMLGVSCGHREPIADYGVEVATFHVGGVQIELVHATDPESSIARYVERNGTGIHHIALKVTDVDKAIDTLEGRGARMIDEQPRTGQSGTRVAFVHPGSTGDVLFELVDRKEPGQTRRTT